MARLQNCRDCLHYDELQPDGGSRRRDRAGAAGHPRRDNEAVGQAKGSNQNQSAEHEGEVRRNERPTTR